MRPRWAWVMATALAGAVVALAFAPAALGDDDDDDDDGAENVPVTFLLDAGPPAPNLDGGVASSVADASATGPTPPVPLAPPHPVGTDPMTLDPGASTSVGGPNTGFLSGGVPLPSDIPGLRSNTNRPNRDGFYGTVEMVRSLVRAAAVVNAEMPGSELTVNDIALPQGGRIRHHGSHQSGRDVDVLFYLHDRRGRPRPAVGVPLDPQGRGYVFNNLASGGDDVRVKLDARRTWRFVRAMLEDEEAAVQRVYVVEHLRTLLLREARRQRAPAAVRRRFEESTCQPGRPHDDHLHLRLYCTPDDMRDGRCTDSAPMYPWRRAQLRTAGLDPAMQARVRRPRGPRPAATPRRRGGGGLPAAATPTMHERARTFLALRETWSRPPRTGRSFCR
ncbi:MAG: penicillin-insensitive murein endopeptidase [Deltaproteobacteria bacterium]|nr:penicillin-insensitive murein endopeptidase [Deltaproteobacteria bacterium]